MKFLGKICFDNIKSHEKPELFSLSRKGSFGKTTVGVKIDPLSFLKVKKFTVIKVL